MRRRGGRLVDRGGPKSSPCGATLAPRGSPDEGTILRTELIRHVQGTAGDGEYGRALRRVPLDAMSIPQHAEGGAIAAAHRRHHGQYRRCIGPSAPSACRMSASKR